MSGPLVIATMEGRKTQTRRVVNPQPPEYINELHGGELSKRVPYSLEDYETGCVLGQGFEDDQGVLYKCPYGVPGDRLWVREAWRPIEKRDGTDGVEYRCDGVFRPIENTADAADAWLAVRRPEEQWPSRKPVKWRPSIHMPRWASRLLLEVTGIRVERVQDISVDDCFAEGIECPHCPLGGGDGPCVDVFKEFGTLWDSINADRKDKDGNRLPYAWKDNPFIWVISYKMLEENDV